MLNSLDPGKRLLVYIVVNIVVSALTTLIVLTLWTRITLGDVPQFGSPSTESVTTSDSVISAVIGAGDLENEHVIIEYNGSEDLSLSGWRLRNAQGVEYRFPALVLHPGAEISVFSRQGEDSASNLFWDRLVPMWDSGDQVTLLDPSGRTQATYKVP
jgi:hypothetical protein